MRLVDLEAMNEWPVICSAVACETCGAGAGEPCLARKPYGGIAVKRGDFHAPRKLAAQKAWEQSKVDMEVAEAVPPVENSHGSVTEGTQPVKTVRRRKNAQAGNP